MKRPTLPEVPGLWTRDGSLRDLYVLHTSESNWDAFLDFAAQFLCTYSYNGEARSRPTIGQLLKDRDGSHLMSIVLGAATATCHFFVESEIELDIDPKEIEGPSEHDQVLRFMEGLATAVGKPVLLTPENGPDIPYLSCEPGCTWRRHA